MGRTYLPSIKTLEGIAGDRAAELREVLGITTRTQLEAKLEAVDSRGIDLYPVTKNWYQSCYHPLEIERAKMGIADEIIGGHGVEYVSGGKDRKRSPGFDYVNVGDPYIATLCKLEHGGAYRVCGYGDIVERGNYA